MPLQITRDQMSEAVVDFKQAAQLRFEYADTHYNLGVAYLVRQKREAEETPVILVQLKSDLAAKLDFFD